MAAIKGGVKVTGFISPTDDGDEYPVIDPVYGIGGLREVPDLTARDAIPELRRRAGMLVVTQSDLKTWQLQGDLATWTEYNTGGGSSSPTNFEIELSLTGGVLEGEMLSTYAATVQFLLSENLTGSVGACYNSDPVTVNVLILKNLLAVGKVIISDSVVTFDLPSSVEFLPGTDVLAFQAETFALFQTLSFTLRAERVG
ncbi:hypothetical protein [Sinorhizobium meliloti]|uniref:hypothetical protein n=1 Tax=Rhizobium meliloti TaxID=382 RepID=UPI0012961EE5|nr:hypothetical protein [Sinorhizobium meliloti]MDW9491680.1 hypothetical protein [Sinorhizobium meliloti]MQV02946.1 hypothetical protein [Sinorhizobium meliloti]